MITHDHMATPHTSRHESKLSPPTLECCMADRSPSPANANPGDDSLPEQITHTTVSLTLCDSGSNCTAVTTREALEDFQPYDPPRQLGLASAATTRAMGEGWCPFDFLATNGHWIRVRMKALLIPDFRRPIVSACKLRATTGWTFTPEGNFQVPSPSGPCIVPIHTRNDQWWLVTRMPVTTPDHAPSLSPQDPDWHGLTPAMRETVIAGRVSAPRLGARRVQEICSCTTAQATQIIASAEHHINMATATNQQPPSPPPTNVPPPPPPQKSKHSKYIPLPNTRGAPHDGRPVSTNWPVSPTERSRINAMNIDDLTRRLGLPPDAITRNVRQACKLRLAKLGVYPHPEDSAHDILLSWHHRLCHPSLRATALFLRLHNKHGKLNLSSVQKLFCDTCMRVKSKRVKFKASDHTPRSETDHMTHWVSDSIGPMPASRRNFTTCVFFLSNHDVAYMYFARDLKQHTFEHIQRQWTDDVRRDLADIPGVQSIDMHFTPKQNVQLQCDNAPYYVSTNARKVWRELGVNLKTSIPFLSQSNGRAEQFVGNIRRRAACSLAAAGLAKRVELWPEAFQFALDSHQILPNAGNGNISPYEYRTGRSPDISTIHPPFCSVYVWRPIKGRENKQTPGRKGIYLGRSRLNGSNVVLLEGEHRETTVASHHCNFNTTLPPMARNRWFLGKAPTGFRPRVDIQDEDDDVIDIDEINSQQTIADPDTINIDLLAQTAHITDPDTPDLTNLNIVTTDFTLSDQEFMHNLSKKDSTDGMHYCYSNALRDKKWGALVEEATNKELTGLHTSGCLVQVPASSMALDADVNRVVPIFMPKHATDAARTFIKYKTRICFAGKHFCKDPAHPDYIPTFTSQPKSETWRLHLSLIPTITTPDGTVTKIDTSDWVHAKADVAQAYLSVNFSTPTGTPVYLKLPADLTRQAIKIGMAQPDPGGVIFSVKRAVYGIASAARLFEQALTKHITQTMKCRQSNYEPNMFHRDTVRFLVHSDDCHFIGKKSDVDTIIDELEAHYGNMKREYWPTSILGWDVAYAPDRSVHLSAAAHIDKLREKCAMTNRFPRYTPMRSKAFFTKHDRSEGHVGVTKIAQKMTGIVNYIAQIARPDLSFTSSQYGIVASCPKRDLVRDLTHTARYLDCTSHYALKYNKTLNDDTNRIIAHVDASDGDGDQCKSQTGLTVFMNGAPVAWTSVRQTTVSLSTGESELKATCLAAREILFLRGVLTDMGHPQPSHPGTLLHSDSEVAIAWNKNPSLSKKNKHLNRQAWFCREQIAAGLIEIKHQPSKQMVADIQTKNLPRETHTTLCKMLFNDQPRAHRSTTPSTDVDTEKNTTTPISEN